MIHDSQIQLWQAARAVGVSVKSILLLKADVNPTTLRGYLNGWAKMPNGIEALVRRMIAERSAPTSTDRGQA